MNSDEARDRAILLTAPKVGESINCLRCQHCKLLPHSNFEYESVPILCQRLGRNIPMKLHPCSIADPRRCDFHGDFLYRISRVEKAFLRHHYPRSPLDFIVRATGRDAATVRTLCNRMGLHRPESLIKHGREWPEAQRAYVSSCINSTFWTKRGFGSMTARAREAKAEIVRRVAQLGPERSWLEIRKYAKSLTPAYMERKARKTARHKQLMARQREERIAAMAPERRADFYRRSEGMRRGQENRLEMF